MSSTRIVRTLSVLQALGTAALAVDLTLTGLTGYELAPNKALATLPFAVITVASAIVTWFASVLMGKVGRKWGFIIGALACAFGGLMSVWSISVGNFWAFCLGTAAVGVFQSFAQYYRLAAADSQPSERKAKAISTVLLGGVVAAVLGPALAAYTKNALTQLYAGSYLLVFVFGALSAAIVAVFYTADDIVPVAASTNAPEEPPRSVGTVLLRPISLAAIANNVIGGAVMILVMTASPLAAVVCGHTVDDGANIIQWHLVGMFAPSLFAGRLIKRFGLTRVLYAGMVLTAACCVVALQSTTTTAFLVALLLLGVGWNFMFVGGTLLLAESYRPNERSAVQGMAEAIRGGVSAIAALSAGPLLEYLGWTGINIAVFPLVVVAALMTYAWRRSELQSGKPVLN